MRGIEIATYKTSLKIAGIYALAGCLWILFSDEILGSMVSDPATITHMQTYKGWFYVVLTAALVFVLINKNLREIKKSREALQEREVRYRTLFEDSPIPFWECDLTKVKQDLEQIDVAGFNELEAFFRDHPQELLRVLNGASIIDVNSAAVALFDAPDKETLINKFSSTLSQEAYAPLGEALAGLIMGQRIDQTELPLQSFSGRKLCTLISLAIAPGSEQTWSRVLVSVIDESYRRQAQIERARLESQLRQAQRMESMGVLAGGIAHDFNNILTPLCGYASIAYEELPDDSPAREDLEQVIRAADRARELVAQIVTFSRNAEQEKKHVDMPKALFETLKLIRPTFPSSIEIRQDIDASAGSVMADPSQIQRILMNLFTNAYQAMQETGGVLDVSLKRVGVAGTELDIRRGLDAGNYVELTVADTGEGMDASVQERIFEPFFTTKGVGKGTGLGLSVVHGIVKSYGGDITVTSAPNEGASFTVRLPLSSQVQSASSESMTEIPSGTERIIVVDDEEQITSIIGRILSRLGYNVRTFTSSLEVLDLLRTGAESCDLLITDYTMPHLSGKELATEITKINPRLPVIMISGIHVDASYEKSRGVRIVDIIMKPISKRSLANAVRRALDAGIKSSSGTVSTR